MSRCEKIGKYSIYLDQIYYLTYAGGKRELTSKNQKNWDKTKELPELLRKKEQIKLGYDNNPDVIPLKGIELLSFIKELQFVPFFDKYFEYTHLLKLTDVFIYESIKQKNYEIAMKK